MLERFTQYNKEQQLFQSNDKLLIGVSGGMDSICLITLLQRMKIQFSIAHCNFQLRGKESNADEAFVEKLAHNFNRPFHKVKFDTKNIAKERKSSIQIVARELRYEWFEKIRQKYNYQYIATAHHITDSIETVFLNMAKGCGIRGLHGILPKNDKIIRPLSCFTRREIQDFMDNNQIQFREDISNSSIKYQRNFVRHEILPKFRTLNPVFDEISGKFFKKMQDTEALMLFAVQNIQKEIVTENDDEFIIDLLKLKKFPSPNTVLFELIRDFGFNGVHVIKILDERKTKSGKLFISKSRIKGVLHHNQFIIQKKNPKVIDQIEIKNEGIFKFNGFQISIQAIEKPESLKTGPKTIIIDKNILQFPILVRYWKDGDSFQPFGMHGQRQKLKDFFVHQKAHILAKVQIPILESNGKILWIAGYRMADWCKVTPKTTGYLKIEITE